MNLVRIASRIAAAVMNYGDLPDEEEFSAAFAKACPGGKFQFGNDKRVGNASLTKEGLWNELLEASQEPGDEAGQWCSSVLSVLGFEWV